MKPFCIVYLSVGVCGKSDARDPQSALIGFVMPQNFTLDTLPLPLDQRITLKEVQAKTVAVRTYSGSWSQKKYNQQEGLLLGALLKAKIKTIGKPIFARYNSPFALWFMRRNEIIIEIER